MAKLTPFGREVRKRLIDLDMSQVELGRRIGCSRHYVWRILTGDRTGDKYVDAIRRVLSMRDDARRGA